MIGKWIIYACIAFALCACDAFQNTEIPSLGKENVFQEVKLPALGELLHSTKIEGMRGRDQMIRAQGTFALAQREKIIEILQSNGFVATDEFLFATGDTDPWWSVEGEVVERSYFDKQRPGKEAKMKLFQLKDGSGFFQFEEIDI